MKLTASNRQHCNILLITPHIRPRQDTESVVSIDLVIFFNTGTKKRIPGQSYFKLSSLKRLEKLFVKRINMNFFISLKEDL